MLTSLASALHTKRALSGSVSDSVVPTHVAYATVVSDQRLLVTVARMVPQGAFWSHVVRPASFVQTGP